MRNARESEIYKTRYTVMYFANLAFRALYNSRIVSKLWLANPHLSDLASPVTYCRSDDNAKEFGVRNRLNRSFIPQSAVLCVLPQGKICIDGLSPKDRALNAKEFGARNHLNRRFWPQSANLFGCRKGKNCSSDLSPKGRASIVN